MKIQFKQNSYAIKRVHRIDFTGGFSNYEVTQVIGQKPFEIERIEYPFKGCADILVHWEGKEIRDGGKMTYLVNVPKALFEEVK